jgi:riboflavin synthase
MFTGLVTDVGRLVRSTRSGLGSRLVIQCRLAGGGLNRGESISVSGVCLTVEECDGSSFTATASPETLRVTNLGFLVPGEDVNLERAVRPDDRLGGHLVQGHVDGLGRIRRVVDEGVSRVVTVLAPAEILQYVVERGSMAVDGVSLTVTAVDREGFQVTLIPATRESTTLGECQPGDRVNLEVDIISKYVARHLQSQDAAPSAESRAAAWLRAGERD